MLDGLLGQHLAHVGTAGGVSDQRGAVADEGDGLVARHLQALHQTQSHKVADMQRVRRAVKADVERGLAVVDHLADLFLIRDLGDQAAGCQFFINSHFSSFLSIVFVVGSCAEDVKNAPCLSTEGDIDRGTTSYSPRPHEHGLIEC